MSKSNYQIMQGQMAERFLQYNQEQMTEKFQLPCDENYIYVTFVSSLYRINRQTGEIQVQEPERKTGERRIIMKLCLSMMCSAIPNRTAIFPGDLSA